MKFFARFLSLAAAALLIGAGSARAQVLPFIWTGASAVNGSVLDSNNWQTHAPAVPAGSGSEDFEFGDMAGTQTSVLLSTIAIRNITFNGSSPPSYTFSGLSGNQTVTLNGDVTMAAANSVTFDNTLAIVLSSGIHVLNVDPSSFGLTVNGNVSGAGSIRLTNANIVTLNGTNTYSGGTTIDDGLLQIGPGGSITHSAADTLVGTAFTPISHTAYLTLATGSTLSDNYGRIGVGSASANGLVTVDGTGTVWSNATYLYVGELGGGTLVITNGAGVTSADTSIGNNLGGMGSILVSGVGSHLTNSVNLYVGALGYGVFQVDAGATATNVVGSIGNNAGGAGGYATVSGPGSIWTNTGDLFVGGSAAGTLWVDTGGVLNSANGWVGSAAGATGISFLSGPGSAWNLSGNLYLGYQGSGILYAFSDSLLNVDGGLGTIVLGSSVGASGSLFVGTDGEGSLHGAIINANAITTGSGSGCVYLDTANTYTSAAPYFLTKDGTSGGTPVLITGPTTVTNILGYNVLNGANTYSGGTVIIGGTLVAGSNSALGTGTVTLGGGVLSLAPGVTLGNALDLAGGGALGGRGTFGGPVSIGPSVFLSPGNSVGLLTFAGGITWAPAGSYNIEVQGAAGARGVGYDSIDVTGGLTFTATLGSPFTLNLLSLDVGGAPGAVTDFNSSTGYAWLIAHTDGLTGFTAANIIINPSGFTNSTGIGGFYVSTVGNDIYLNFSPVPEPSTYALLGLGLSAMAGAMLRRRRRHLKM